VSASRKIWVFVSYSQDSPEHGDRVQDMVEVLEILAGGEEELKLEVFFDRHQNPQPDSWRQETKEKLEHADRVICICSTEYAACVANRVSGGTRRGATYEGRLLADEVYETKNHERVLAVIPKGGSRDDVPQELGGAAAASFMWPTEVGALYDKLIVPTRRRQLYDACEAAYGDRADFVDWVSPWLPSVAQDPSRPRAQVIHRAVYYALRAEAQAQEGFLVDLARRAPAHREALELVAEAWNLEPSWDLSVVVDDPQTLITTYLTAADAAYNRVRVVEEFERWRIPLDLDTLFVPLHAWVDHRAVAPVMRCGDEARAELDAEWRRDAVELLRVFSTEVFDRPSRAVVVLGDPGSGKTTQLHGMLLELARVELDCDAIARMGLPVGTVPVFLPLTSLASGVSLAQHIQAEAGGLLGAACPSDFAERILAQRSVLLLCDGLDEVADPGARAEVSTWLATALRQHPQCRMIVTCRYAGYTERARLPPEFLETNLHGLSVDAVEKFVEGFFVRVATHLLGKSSPQRAAREAAARREAEVFVAELRKSRRSPRVAEMTSNPLLLTMVCLVHKHGGPLPDNRAALYERVCRYLVKRWAEVDGVPNPDFIALRRVLAEGEKADVPGGLLAVLEPLAEWMHRREDRQVRGDELARELQPRLDRLARGISAKEVLRSVGEQSGLLTGWSADRYGFLHLGFQEHLAAKSLRARAGKDPSVWGELAEHFGQEWWQEVTLLLLGADTEAFAPFMRRLLARDDASECVRSTEMGLCWSEAAGAGAEVLVEVLRSEKIAQEHGVAVLELLAERSPEVLGGLGLSGHAVGEVRSWWRARQAGERGVVVAETSGVELVRIPGGTFWMGSLKKEGGEDNERPRHEVTLSEFELGRYPVTNEEYGRYLAANPGATEPEEWGNRKYNQARQPVVGVSWGEALRYCKWAGLTLPTEAQWECACRAGTETRYWSGDSKADLDRVGWYNKNSGGQTHVVGEKEANAFGLYDVHGNVWEWCKGAHGSYDVEPRAGDGLRHQPEHVRYRVLRGGSWFLGAEHARAAYRHGGRPGVRDWFVGFRVARVIT